MRFWSYYYFGYRIVDLFNRLYLRATIVGLENVPAGGCLVVANHVSFLDPTTVAWSLGKEVHYLARKNLLEHKFLGWWLPRVNVVPIDQDRPDMTGLRRVIKLLKDGETVILFPEGARSFDGKLAAGQPGSGLVAVKAGVPILPVRLFGTYEALPRGSSKLNRHGVRIVIGKPFHVPAEWISSKDKTIYAQVATLMMQKIGKLHQEHGSRVS